MSQELCCTGHLHEGTAVGSFTNVAGLETYISGEKGPKALLILTDIFGFGLNNTKLLADFYAKEAKVTVYIPDVLGGKPAPTSLLQDPSGFATFDIRAFLGANSKEKRYPEIVAVAKELKEKHGVTHLASIGICYGGWATLQLSRDKLIDVVIAAHPSMVDMSDIQSVVSPSLWLCATKDDQMTKEKRMAAQDYFDTNTKFPAKFVTYPGTQHGFTVRGDSKDEHVRIAAEDAAQQVVMHLNRFLR